jgi:Family of unknown function (DUF6159)
VFARFARSWDLAQACIGVLIADKSLLVFPLLSSVAMVLIVGTFAIPLIPAFGFLAGHGSDHVVSAVAYVALFIFYWLQFTIVIFFNTALVEVAMRHFDGQQAGLGDGLRRAWSRLPMIMGYALIAATVGTLLRFIAERVGLIGKLVIGLIGLAWSVATALVVPVLAAENVGPIDVIGRSTELIKKAWGEQMIGNAGIGIVFFLASLLGIACGGFLVIAAFASHQAVAGVVLLILLILGIGLLAIASSALQGIYSAALYRYANGKPTHGIDQALLSSAFQPKT